MTRFLETRGQMMNYGGAGELKMNQNVWKEELKFHVFHSTKTVDNMTSSSAHQAISYILCCSCLFVSPLVGLFLILHQQQPLSILKKQQLLAAATTAGLFFSLLLII